MRIPLQMSDVKVVLLGSTGAGKSASGNTIIGGERKIFKVGYSAESETKICQPAQKEVAGQTISVIDTVGLSDTVIKKNKGVQNKIEQIFDCTCHGVDVFLLVIKVSVKFTEEVVPAVKWIHENFGAKVLKHTIVLFTHGDQLYGTIEDYVSKCEALRSIVDQCSGGFHVFNNKDEDPSQVTELLDKINKLRRKNVCERYTEQDYKETQDTFVPKEKCVTRAAVRAAVGAAVRAALRAAFRAALKAAIRAAIGGVLAAVGGAAAAYMGEVYLPAGKAATAAATAAVASGTGVAEAVVGVELYYFV